MLFRCIFCFYFSFGLDFWNFFISILLANLYYEVLDIGCCIVVNLFYFKVWCLIGNRNLLLFIIENIAKLSRLWGEGTRTYVKRRPIIAKQSTNSYIFYTRCAMQMTCTSRQGKVIRNHLLGMTLSPREIYIEVFVSIANWSRKPVAQRFGRNSVQRLYVI